MNHPVTWQDPHEGSTLLITTFRLWNCSLDTLVNIFRVTERSRGSQDSTWGSHVRPWLWVSNFSISRCMPGTWAIWFKFRFLGFILWGSEMISLGGPVNVHSSQDSRQWSWIYGLQVSETLEVVIYKLLAFSRENVQSLQPRYIT